MPEVRVIIEDLEAELAGLQACAELNEIPLRMSADKLKGEAEVDLPEHLWPERWS